MEQIENEPDKQDNVSVNSDYLNFWWWKANPRRNIYTQEKLALTRKEHVQIEMLVYSRKYYNTFAWCS